MGNCTKKNRVEPSAQSVYAMNQAVYPRKISVLIKKKDSRGRINETIKVSISHTEPLLCVSEDISISFSIWGTGEI